jgi:hypothetical protein
MNLWYNDELIHDIEISLGFGQVCYLMTISVSYIELTQIPRLSE